MIYIYSIKVSHKISLKMYTAKIYDDKMPTVLIKLQGWRSIIIKAIASKVQ